MQKTGILQLFKSSQTVFTFQEIALILGDNKKENLAVKIKYYLDKGDLIRLRKGIYAKEKYNKLEFATKIYTPSYISFETALRKEGVIFQHYEDIFLASYLSRQISAGKQNISFRRLKEKILLNEQGIVRHKENYFIASRERAFLDMIYLFPNYYFDNLDSIDWDKCKELVNIYDNKQMIKRLNSYAKLEKT
ncbi:MAG: type IV toxin-antitoxin system AbiEi family antitoxin domain-containing protein [Candidatus Falkowbacteria bacterium]